MISESKDDNDRNFLISFYCGDDTIQIYQNADKNSGIWGGKFSERQKYKKDDRYLEEKDFQIGGFVKLGPYTFQLLKADDFTIEFMKEHPEIFPEINLNANLDKLKALSSNHKSYDDFLIWVLKSKILEIFRFGSTESWLYHLRPVP